MVNTFEAAVVIVRDISPSPLDAANIGRGIFRARPSHDWRNHCIIGNVSKMRDVLPHYRETHHFILLESEKVKYDGEENLGVVNVHQSFTPRPLSPRAGIFDSTARNAPRPVLRMSAIIMCANNIVSGLNVFQRGPDVHPTDVISSTVGRFWRSADAFVNSGEGPSSLYVPPGRSSSKLIALAVSGVLPS